MIKYIYYLMVLDHTMSIATNNQSKLVSSDSNVKQEPTTVNKIALTDDERDFLDKDKKFKHENADWFNLDDGPISVHFYSGWQKDAKSEMAISQTDGTEYPRTVLVLEDMNTENFKKKKLGCTKKLWSRLEPMIKQGWKILSIERTGSQFKTDYTVMPITG